MFRQISLKQNFPESVKYISRSSQDLQVELRHAVSSACSVEAAQQLRVDCSWAVAALPCRAPQLAGPRVHDANPFVTQCIRCPLLGPLTL
jgi:predicted Co/Zn/Cd cation transporter (cation efflux family)